MQDLVFGLNEVRRDCTRNLGEKKLGKTRETEETTG
jgi:hypothetical protein